jgi:hypothetical protein
MQGYGGKELEGKSHFEGKYVNGRIILKFILNFWVGDCALINLAQNRDQWRVLVSTETKLSVP